MAFRRTKIMGETEQPVAALQHCACLSALPLLGGIQ